MILSVHQPQYIPWLGFFDKISKSDLFVFLDEVQYKEREFQNRNKIRTDKGTLWLTVPVISKGLGRQKISEVRIDNEIDWRKQHFLSFKTFYAHAAFFKQHVNFLEDLYERKWDMLVDLNVFIIKYILDCLKITTPISFESKIKTSKTKTERIIELCQKLNADTYLSGAGGRAYLEENRFEEVGIKLLYQDFKHPVYRQQFLHNSGDFLPHLSIFDLLLNEGPGSRGILGREDE